MGYGATIFITYNGHEEQTIHIPELRGSSLLEATHDLTLAVQSHARSAQHTVDHVKNGFCPLCEDEDIKQEREQREKIQAEIRAELITTALVLARQRDAHSESFFGQPVLHNLVKRAIELRTRGVEAGMSYEFDRLLGITSRVTDG